MAKEVIFGEEARRRMKGGIDKLADAVRITLGPRGRNVILSKKFGSPDISDDGVTIAQEQEYKDEFENMGAQLVKEVASKTNDIAGDGTTTATILAHAMIDEGFKMVAAGGNPGPTEEGDGEGGDEGRGIAEEAEPRPEDEGRDRAGGDELRARRVDREDHR